MNLLLYFFLILPTFGLIGQDTVSASTENNGDKRELLEENQCPDWLHPNDTQHCQCISDILQCNITTQEASVLDCYCVTTSESNEIEVGNCIYNCEYSHSGVDKIYRTLPDNISALTGYFCDVFNRQGRLCGQCKDDHNPPMYSYKLKCIKCKRNYQWIIYITAAFVPLTIFFIIVVCFRISATSPQLNGYVIVAQTLTVPPNLRVVLLALEGRTRTTVLTSILASLYGIWNLDFFRMLIPDICIHLSTLQTLALDYTVALYPLILTIICYIAFQLYSYNFRVVLCFMRPFIKCSTRIRDQMDARTSLIDAFATFLLLSYIRLISVSFDLLVPTRVYNINTHKSSLYLYYDASIVYFGKEHLPYAIPAIAVVMVFILFPLFLLLAFPMRCFQRFLGKHGLQYQALRIFIDSFQGCYKDGTDGTRDFRYFSGIYLLIRIFLFFIYGITLNMDFYGIAALTLMVLAAALTITQPYKRHLSVYNAVETVHILLLAMWLVSVVCINVVTLKSTRYIKGFLAFSVIVAALPLLYISFVALMWIFTREKVQMKLNKYFTQYKRNQYQELQGNDAFLKGIDQLNEESP